MASTTLISELDNSGMDQLRAQLDLLNVSPSPVQGSGSVQSSNQGSTGLNTQGSIQPDATFQFSRALDTHITHVINVVLKMSSYEATQVQEWMRYNGILTMETLLQVYSSTPSIIKEGNYEVLNTWCCLTPAVCNRLVLLCDFAISIDLAEDEDWLTVTNVQFKEFWKSQLPSSTTATPINSPRAHPNSRNNAPTSTTSLSSIDTPLAKLFQFSKSMKPDENKFPKLMDNKHTEPFWRQFKAIAKHQNMSEVLDPTFVPDPAVQGAQQWFAKQQWFMYVVVSTCFCTPNTRSFVLEHDKDFDAQKVIAKFITFMKDSPRTQMEITRLTSYICNIHLDGSWKGTSEHFLLHYKEQLRLLDELVPPDERMNARLRRLFLEKAVQDIPFLRNITNTDEYQRVLNHDISINYEQYFNLLLVASQRYDYQNVSYQKRRSVHNHYQDSHYTDPQEDTGYGYMTNDNDVFYPKEDDGEAEAYEFHQASSSPPFRGPPNRGFPPFRGPPTRGPPPGVPPQRSPP